ncbi:hypothetical protein [Oryza sativa Japonica Group]|uniref:Uncharacterized protein n=1 Tax=Oryza sativa subsp. japonica TaxID=39947 RepID=Q5NAQ3_ORYSJ|nr:hypothetical protein [Oryza sativa Japonica Group]
MSSDVDFPACCKPPLNAVHHRHSCRLPRPCASSRVALHAGASGCRNLLLCRQRRGREKLELRAPRDLDHCACRGHGHGKTESLAVVR